MRLCKDLQECDIDNVAKIIIKKGNEKIPRFNNRMTKKKINLAIVGLGNIGLNLYKHLIKNKKSIIEKNNVFFDIKYVSAKIKKKTRYIYT